MSAESSFRKLHGLLFNGGDTSTDHFHHLFLLGGEAGNLTNDLSDDSNSLALGVLSAGILCPLGVHLRLSHDVAIVQANEDLVSSLIF